MYTAFASATVFASNAAGMIFWNVFSLIRTMIASSYFAALQSAANYAQLAIRYYHTRHYILINSSGYPQYAHSTPSNAPAERSKYASQSPRKGSKVPILAQALLSIRLRDQASCDRRTNSTVDRLVAIRYVGSTSGSLTYLNSVGPLLESTQVS